MLKSVLTLRRNNAVARLPGRKTKMGKSNKFVHPEPHNIMRPLMVKTNIGGKYNAKYK